MESKRVLHCDEISAGYGAVPVLSSISLEVGEGEIVGLFGRNGVGKTTMLRTISGVIKPLDGAMHYQGKELSGPIQERARAGIAYVTEERAIIRGLTARENLLLQGRRTVAKAIDLFPELSRVLDTKAGMLSGGEQQMLVLGRVLGGQARLLLVDELSFGLAPLVVRRLLEALHQAAKETGASVLAVEQHPAMLFSVISHGYVLNEGGVQLSGTTAELKQRMPEILAAYFGPKQGAQA